MKKILYIVLSVIAILAVVTVWRITTIEPVEFQSPSEATAPQTEDVTLIIDYPVQDDLIVSQTYQPDQTVFKFMQDGSLEFEYDEYDFGTLITSIGGVTGGTDNNYWIYYINNETAQVGVSDYILNPGDVITWHFESDYGVEE